MAGSVGHAIESEAGGASVVDDDALEHLVGTAAPGGGTRDGKQSRFAHAGCPATLATSCRSTPSCWTGRPRPMGRDSSAPAGSSRFDDRLAFVGTENIVTAKIAEQVGIGPDGAAGTAIRSRWISSPAMQARPLPNGYRSGVADQTERVTPLHPPRSISGDGGNGNGRDLHERLSAVEARLRHFATKEDIRRIEGLISRREASMLPWVIGILGVAFLSMVVALLCSVIADPGQLGT